MQLRLSPGTRGTRTGALYRQLLDAIRTGRLVAGERLPTSRELAADLRIARGTVVAALDRLVAEGLVVARPGSGLYVAEQVVPTRRPRAPRGVLAGPRPVWSALPPPADTPPALPFDLSFGGPDPGLFPLATWRRLASATLRGDFARLDPYATPDDPPLQRQIARHLARSRAVRASAADVVVTAGAQQGFDLVARVLLAPGDPVVVEDPGYTAGVRLLASHGARLVPVPVDAEGLVVDRLPTSARLVYVTPSHQFPTGGTLSAARRAALLEWAARCGAVIVEDDYDSEFRFADRPLEPLQSLDAAGRVIYLGSFSKVLLPGLRVGFLIAPALLQPALREAKALTQWQGDALTHGILSRFLDEGLLAAHVRRTTRVYRQRRAALLDALGTVPQLRVLPSVAGLHVAAEFTDQSLSDRAVVQRAAAAGVGVEPLSPRYLGPPRQGLVLGFRHITTERLPEAVERLEQVLARIAHSPRSE